MKTNKKFLYIPEKEDDTLPKFIMVHVPKTGGNTFRRTIIHPLYGRKHVNEHKDRFNINKSFAFKNFTYEFNRLKDADKYLVISGHFKASKYKFLNRPIIAWVRHPIKRAISHYYNWIDGMKDKQTRAPIPQSEYDKLPWLKYFEDGMNLVEFSQMFGDYMTHFFDIPLKEFAFIGVLERYEESVIKFGKIFNLKIPRVTKRYNVRGPHFIDGKIQKAMEKYHKKDFEIYNKAMEMI